VQQQACAVVELEQQVLADAREGLCAPTREALAQRGGRRDEEVAWSGGVDLRDRASDEARLELAPGDFDFGQLWHAPTHIHLRTRRAQRRERAAPSAALPN
jgi:hypothetical protein